MTDPTAARRPTAVAALARAMTSWRTASVALLSFPSGLPLGLVWIAIPDWLRSGGVDIRVIGLVTLAQAPWSFKVVWAPLMDRYAPPFWGRRRGWVALTQVALIACLLGLAALGHHPTSPWLIGVLALAIAFAAATQDIAYDAYTVDVLRPEEQGVAVGARTALYRAAMYVAGGLAITLAGVWSWPVVDVGLALLLLPFLVVTGKAPEPAQETAPPASLRDALWYPFLGFLARPRALEILAFVFFYKLADNLAGALLRPFLVDMGFGDFDRGVALATVGLLGTIVGTFLGGVLTTAMGLGHALWVFGAVQIVSNVGYVLIARAGLDRALMYGATGFESLTSGLGTGAFAVLLLRLTERRFSATQYALFSSLFGLPRIVAGPLSGLAVDAVGWEPFFWSTMAAGIPGLVLLHRFSPLGVREPRVAPEHVHAAAPGRPLSRAGLAARGIAGGAVALLLGAVALGTLGAVKAAGGALGRGVDPLAGLGALVAPADLGGWLQLAGLLVFALVAGLATAAVFAARGTRGAG